MRKFSYFMIFSFSLLTFSCVDIDTDFPVPPASTVANFDFEVIDRDTRTVRFIDKSIIPERAGGAIYTWNFGDGSTSGAQEPEHSFSQYGEFDVKLVLITASSGEVREITKTVAVLQPFDFDFTLYYLDSDLLKIVGLSETNPTELDVAGFGLGMAIDKENNMLYYTDDDNDAIYRVKTDGTNRQQLYSGFNRVTGIALDTDNGRVYWTSRGDGAVYRGNMDGSGSMEAIVTGMGLPDAVAYHNGKIYISDVDVPDNGGENIYVANANGSSLSVFVSGAWGYGLGVDKVNERLYYGDQGDYDDPADNRIRSVALSNPTDIKTVGNLDASGANGSRTYGIDFDHEANKVYWTDRNTRRIVRANFDGSQQETVTVVQGSPRGLAVGN